MVSEDDLQPDLADRLKKSLKLAGLSHAQMADYLEVHRVTVGNWLNRRATPRPANIRLWAHKTSVPYEWLRDGKLPRDDDDQAEHSAPEWLREVRTAFQQMSAALQQIAEQLEGTSGPQKVRKKSAKSRKHPSRSRK